MLETVAYAVNVRLHFLDDMIQIYLEIIGNARIEDTILPLLEKN